MHRECAFAGGEIRHVTLVARQPALRKGQAVAIKEFRRELSTEKVSEKVSAIFSSDGRPDLAV